EEGHEETDAAIGDDGAGEHDGENGTPRPQSFGHKAGDCLDRAAVLHELSEQGSEKKEWEELRQEMSPADHEDLGPVGKKRFARRGSRDEGCGRRKEKDTPAAISEPD